MSDQEDTLYQHITAGEWDEVESLRVAAHEDGSGEQFDQDYLNAYAHYQRDHEMPEEERVQATAEVVETENNEAQEGVEVEE